MAADLSNLVAVLQRKIKERDSKIKNLEEQLQDAGKAGGKQGGAEGPADLQERVLTLESENARLKEDLANARGTGPGTGAVPVTDLVQDLQKKIKKKEEEIARLKSDHKEPEGAKSSEVDHAACQQRIDELSADLQQAQDALKVEKASTGSDKRVGQLQALIQELQAGIASRDSELSLLKGNVPPPKDLSEEVQRLVGEVATLTTQKQKVETEVESLSQKTIQLQTDLGDSLAKNSKLLADLDALMTEKEKNKVAIDDLQAQLLQKEQFLQVQREEISTLKQQVATTIPMKKVPAQGEEVTTGEGMSIKTVVEAGRESPAVDMLIIDSARWVCPKCGNNNRGMIREEEDKAILLNQYPPVYSKKLVCGQCGLNWHHK